VTERWGFRAHVYDHIKYSPRQTGHEFDLLRRFLLEVKSAKSAAFQSHAHVDLRPIAVQPGGNERIAAKQPRKETPLICVWLHEHFMDTAKLGIDNFHDK
jgi:hypothetical protein